jgi:hypothetical protein
MVKNRENLFENIYLFVNYFHILQLNVQYVNTQLSF